MGCKKLLFNNIGGSVTPPPPEGNSPVMEGLVGWYDARDFNNNSLINRVNKNESATITGITGTNFEHKGNLIKLNNGSKINYPNIGISSYFTTVRYPKVENGGGYYYPFNGGTAQLYFSIRNHDKYIYHNMTNTISNYYDGITKTLSSDGVYKHQPDTTSLIDRRDKRIYFYSEHTTPTIKAAYSGIAGDSTNSVMGEFTSMLLYNRVLTEEEINHNYQYELSIDREPTIPKEYVEVAVDGTTTGNLIEPFMIVNLKDSIEDKTYGFCKCTFSGTSVAAMYFKDDLGVEKAFNIQLTGVSSSKTYYLEFYGETGALKLRVREDSEDGKIVKVARDTYTDIKQINITKIARISTLQCRGC